MFITIKGISHETIEENGVLVYKNHFCECPCHGLIKFIRIHKYRGIPKFIHGHNWVGKTHKQNTKDLMSSQRKNIPKSKEHKLKISKIHKGKIVSEETKKQQSIRMFGSGNYMYGIPPSPKCSYGIHTYYQSPLQGQICFRSSYELKYAQYLDSQKILWMYEIETFNLGDTTYTPDFYLPKTEQFIEIKGHMLPTAQQKINLFLEQYPWNLKILYREDLKKLGIKL